MVYDKIEKIRLKNNTNTINILRLAFKYYPTESKDLLIEVNKGDGKISCLLEELTSKKGRDYELILDDLEVLRAQNNKPWKKMYELANKGNVKECFCIAQKSRRNELIVKSNSLEKVRRASNRSTSTLGPFSEPENMHA